MYNLASYDRAPSLTEQGSAQVGTVDREVLLFLHQLYDSNDL